MYACGYSLIIRICNSIYTIHICRAYFEFAREREEHIVQSIFIFICHFYIVMCHFYIHESFLHSYVYSHIFITHSRVYNIHLVESIWWFTHVVYTLKFAREKEERFSSIIFNIILIIIFIIFRSVSYKNDHFCCVLCSTKTRILRNSNSNSKFVRVCVWIYSAIQRRVYGAIHHHIHYIHHHFHYHIHCIKECIFQLIIIFYFFMCTVQ